MPEQNEMVPVIDPASGDAPFLQVKGLCKKTPIGVVFDNVSFSVDKGQICCIFGDQGAGKTSLMLSICGRMKVDRGTCAVGGFDLRSQFRRVRRISAISFIPGINDVQPFLQVKNIAAAEISLGGGRGNKANTDAFLKTWGFLDKKDVKFNELSAYDSALFGVVLAMAANPELLIVDDVQTNLTQHQSIKLVNKLRDIAATYGITVVFGSTEYEIARHADGVVVMSEGAEAQRKAVLRDDHIALDQALPLFGSGNGVRVGASKTDASHEGGESL